MLLPLTPNHQKLRIRGSQLVVENPESVEDRQWRPPVAILQSRTRPGLGRKHLAVGLEAAGASFNRHRIKGAHTRGQLNIKLRQISLLGQRTIRASEQNQMGGVQSNYGKLLAV